MTLSSHSLHAHTRSTSYINCSSTSYWLLWLVVITHTHWYQLNEVLVLAGSAVIIVILLEDTTLLVFRSNSDGMLWLGPSWDPPSISSYKCLIWFIHTSGQIYEGILRPYYHWSWWWVMVMAGSHWLSSNFKFKTGRWWCDPPNFYTHTRSTRES